LPEDAALVVSTSPAVVDLAVGVDVEATYLGPDEAWYNFLLRETFAVRLKNPEGVVVLRQYPAFFHQRRRNISTALSSVSRGRRGAGRRST
jgi:hypothetical protein